MATPLLPALFHQGQPMRSRPRVRPRRKKIWQVRDWDLSLNFFLDGMLWFHSGPSKSGILLQPAPNLPFQPSDPLFNLPHILPNPKLSCWCLSSCSSPYPEFHCPTLSTNKPTHSVRPKLLLAHRPPWTEWQKQKHLLTGPLLSYAVPHSLPHLLSGATSTHGHPRPLQNKNRAPPAAVMYVLVLLLYLTIL